MARWAGWGAGPAGAGAAGGASKVFLALSLVGCIAVTAFLAKEGNAGSAVVAGLAALYFALRLFAGLGRGSR
jgi:hypothetical protein